MAGEGERDSAAGKLSLKRRRQQQQQDPLPLPRRTFAGSSTWFEQQHLSDAESTWKMLLQAVDPHLRCSSFKKVIQFPEFLGKSSQTSNPQPEPETFNVGTKQFQWMPFPLYHREDQMKDSRISPKSTNQIINFTERKKDKKRFSTFSLSPEQKPFTANRDTAEESRTRHTVKRDGRQKSEKSNTHHQNVLGVSAPAPVQSQQQILNSQELMQETATQREGGKAANSDPQIQHSMPFNDVTSIVLAQESPAAGSRVSGFQEKSGDRTEETLTLDRCPMCQMPFTGTLSQLDLDSHLAKCLAESTEDVLW